MVGALSTPVHEVLATAVTATTPHNYPMSSTVTAYRDEAGASDLGLSLN
jgi:hypothetical protein